MKPTLDKQKPTIVVSACLMGDSVRWNSTAATCRFITNELANHVNIITICPEMMMGLGVPRPAIRQGVHLSDPHKKLIVESKSSRDHTELVEATKAPVVEKCHNVEGFIMKAKSPSCGLEKVKLYNLDNGHSIDHRQKGVFAEVLMDTFKDASFIDEGRLIDHHLREHFVIGIFSLFNLKSIEPSLSSLQKFHAEYKYLLMSYNSYALKKLGDLCANRNNDSFESVYDKYYELFSQTIKLPLDTGKVYNTLVHIYGYFKKIVDDKEKHHILGLLDQYKRGSLPMTVPLEILNYLTKKYEVKYLAAQKIFAPYPEELALRRFI
ncbi:PF04463 family protein [Bacteriovorax sp. BSW11_IV]|uniref:YbgA family protein n=1 Tax=Bacteriovorax sp. BSW11_IV TaxID=1353529 RepID=UPI00038A2351|nr:DUF1722 domain-containing protein [Bacteriovorax sp. BSW11_IV]EQC48558.1 PF04463 family protein [Bacteriovorax sp. BSW11_IV]